MFKGEFYTEVTKQETRKTKMNTNVKFAADNMMNNLSAGRCSLSLLFSNDAVNTATVFMAENKPVDVEKLRECNALIKRKFSAFSGLRLDFYDFVAAKAALSSNPETYLDNLTFAYKTFTSKFGRFSSLSVLPAAHLATLRDFTSDKCNMVVDRAWEIYRLIKANHRIVADYNDIFYCYILATQTKPIERIVEECEIYYSYAKRWLSNDSALRLAEILTVFGRNPEESVNRMRSLIKQLGMAHGWHENRILVTALAAMYDVEASEIKEVSDYLFRQKNFGGGKINSSNRLMLASALVILDRTEDYSVKAFVENGIVYSLYKEKEDEESTYVATASWM